MSRKWEFLDYLLFTLWCETPSSLFVGKVGQLREGIYVLISMQQWASFADSFDIMRKNRFNSKEDLAKEN